MAMPMVWCSENAKIGHTYLTDVRRLCRRCELAAFLRQLSVLSPLFTFDWASISLKVVRERNMGVS